MLSYPSLSDGAGLGETAPNWGIGTSDALVAAPAPNANRRNHFTFADAREFMWPALPGGKDQSGNMLAATEAARNTNWAITPPRGKLEMNGKY